MPKTKLITRTKVIDKEVSGDQRFFVCNGQILSSLSELSNALKNMDDSTYSYHVNSEKNDFANWIEGVFSNKSLSNKVSKAKNRISMATIIEEYIK